MSSPGRPSPIPELINFQKWKVSEGERPIWAQPPPRKVSKYPQPVCKTKEMLGATFPLLQLPGRMHSEKGEGQLNPSLATPLSGPAISGTSGAPDWGAEARLGGAGPAGVRLAAVVGPSHGCVRSTRDCTREPSAGTGENLRSRRAFRGFKNLS